VFTLVLNVWRHFAMMPHMGNPPPHIPRFYENLLASRLASERQMAFVSGPRQVGKTTIGRTLAQAYYSWDNATFKKAVLSGSDAVARLTGANLLSASRRIFLFDEIHRFTRWKTFLKGFFDEFGETVGLIVSGSARMDVFKRGGDSLMGRYFPYRVHPFGVGELVRPVIRTCETMPPVALPDAEWEALIRFGGFPEPFLRRDASFATRWRRLRDEQLFREDIRDLTRVMDLDQMHHLALLLAERSGEPLVAATLARDVQVSEPTVKKWVATLNVMYYGFCVRPWHRNVENSLRKTPKWYLRDWSGIGDEGQRNETLVACHLLKAVEAWTDLGLGVYELYYLRDKQKREVDFLVAKNGKPWFVAECKTSDTALSPALSLMQAATGARHAFQIVAELPYVDADCFRTMRPVVVPARTFLSQLP